MMYRTHSLVLQLPKLVIRQLEDLEFSIARNPRQYVRSVGLFMTKSACCSVPHITKFPMSAKNGTRKGNSQEKQRRWPKGLPSIAAFGLVAAVGVQVKDEKKETPRQKLNFFAECSEKAIPAVVHIENRRSCVGGGAGSGFLISSDGLILTNEHVVTSVQNLTIKLYDGRVFPGRVLVVDSNSDLALVKIDEADLPVISLGDSSSMKAGEFVIAIGSPRGFNHTVTTGIISSKARNLGLLGIDTNIDYLQTDAAITNGNSGGPLLNLDGEVIGINSMKVIDGIAFAIPSNYVKTFLERAEKFQTEATERHKSQPAYVGISMLPLSETVTEHLRDQYLPHLQHETGLLLVRVDVGSPAEKAGLQVYDVIFAINKSPTKTSADVSKFITNNKSVTVHFNRKGKDMQTTLEPMPR